MNSRRPGPGVLCDTYCPGAILVLPLSARRRRPPDKTWTVALLAAAYEPDVPAQAATAPEPWRTQARLQLVVR